MLKKNLGSQVPITKYIAMNNVLEWKSHGVCRLNNKKEGAFKSLMKGPWAWPGSSNPKVIRRGFSLKNTPSMSETCINRKKEV